MLCARRKSLFLRSSCHRTPSQYSPCHTARHTFRLQRPSARRLTRIPLPPTTYEHSALPSPLSPRVHQSPHVHQSPVPTELSRLSRSAGCVWQAGHFARHRFNITDVFFAFQPLSYYPLFPPPITLTVIWTSTTSFQLYLLQKLNFVLKKKTPPPSPWQFHRKKWSFFSPLHQTALN